MGGFNFKFVDKFIKKRNEEIEKDIDEIGLVSPNLIENYASIAEFIVIIVRQLPNLFLFK